MQHWEKACLAVGFRDQAPTPGLHGGIGGIEVQRVLWQREAGPLVARGHTELFGDHELRAIPADGQLKTMLDSGTFSLSGLGRSTRVPIKRLGLAVGTQLA